MSHPKSNTPNRDLLVSRFFSGICMFFEVLALMIILYNAFLAIQGRPDFSYSEATFWVVISAVSHNFIKRYRKSVDEEISDLYVQLGQEAETLTQVS